MTEGRKKVPEVRFPGFVEPWVERKLGDVVDVVTDYVAAGSFASIAKNVEYNNSPSYAQLVRTIDLKNHFLNNGFIYVGQSAFKFLWRVNLNLESIILPNIGANIGEVYYVKPEKLPYDNNVLGPNAILLRSKYSNKFLFNLFQTNKFQNDLSIIVASSGQPKFNKTELKEIECVIPNLEEQNKIANAFELIDDRITCQQRKLDHLQLKKKGLLQKLFPRDGATVPELRFPGFSGEWEQRKLGEIATFINGRAYSQKELLDNGKYRVLRVGNFYTNDSWYFSDMELDEKYYANYGDLLYTWSATFGPHIWTGEKVIFHYHIWKVELSSQLEKNFTVQLLERDKNEIISDKNGSTMVHITKNGMEKKEVIIPKNVEEQKKIGEFFDQLDDLITLNQRKVDHLQTQKKAMLQKMFV